MEQAPPILQVHHHQERVKREENDATSNDESTKVKKKAWVICFHFRQLTIMLMKLCLHCAYKAEMQTIVLKTQKELKMNLIVKQKRIIFAN